MRRSLAALAVVLGAHAFGYTVGLGCGSAFNTIDEINNPAEDDALARCRKLGREVADGGDAGAAWNAYVACTVDAGYR